MKIARNLTIFFISLSTLFASCSKDDGTQEIQVGSLKGTAQKGPFLVGSSVTVFELNQQFSQTGFSYFAQITDNYGSFQLNNLSLVSPYVSIKTDGYYFNEVCGKNSNSPITLLAIADIGNYSDLHINLLTHLEKQRVEYLIGSGLPLDSAKHQALSEICSIFSMSPSEIPDALALDISQAGEGNGLLLAISSILQGFRNESELSSFLANFSNDIRTDGTLDDVGLQQSLVDHALALDTTLIHDHLYNYYNGMGVSFAIPPFGLYIQQFLTNTSFTPTGNFVNYPAIGINGQNILDKYQTVYSGNNLQYSFSGQGHPCMYLKFKLKLISGNWWGNALGFAINLSISPMDQVNMEQFFTVIDPALPFDNLIAFNGPPNGTGGTYLLEYYEKDGTTPTFSKTITVTP